MWMESIIPVSGVKGHYTFSAVTSSVQMITDQLDDNDREEDLPDAIKATKSSKTGAIGNVVGVDGDGEGAIEVPMDIDQFLIGTSVSLSSKWKHSLLNTSTHLLPSGHVISAPTTVTSSESASKKLSSSKGKQTTCKAVVKSTSSSAAHKSKSSASRAEKISQTTILHGMQGTMNWVTDIFKKSVPWLFDFDAWNVQTCEDGFCLADQKKLVILFMKDPVTVQLIIGLEMRLSGRAGFQRCWRTDYFCW